MYKKAKLDNGLRIVTYRMSGMESVALGIWIKVGGRYESEQNKGLSHFLEHMLFKGTKKYSCRKLKESIEGVGGSLNGFTSEEVTCYLVKIPGRHLDLALDVLSDMVINPVLSPEDIEKEKTVILEEIKMYKDLPQSYVYELLDNLLWPGQPLGMSILGTQESVGGFNREFLDSYKKKYYVPFNMVVSAAGALIHTEFVGKVENRFKQRIDTGINAFLPVREEQKEPQFEILAKDTEQTHLALGFHSIKRDHPLRYALDLLHVILGGNMSSRLFDELREKRGLAYDIGTQVKRYYDTGAFIVHAGIDNHKVSEAIKLILEELKRVKDKLVSESEFKRAKEFYLGQLRLALEDTLDHMLWIGEHTIALDKMYSLKEVINGVKKIKPRDLKEVSRAIFKNEGMNLALIGPLEGQQGMIEGLLHI